MEARSIGCSNASARAFRQHRTSSCNGVESKRYGSAEARQQRPLGSPQMAGCQKKDHKSTENST